jgi:hypothetical protein
VTLLRLLPVIGCVLACAGGTAATPRAPTTARPLPHAGAADADLAAFGRALHAALSAGRPADVVLDDAALERLLSVEAEQRWIAMRAQAPGPARLPDVDRQQWQGTRYAELCVQQGRLESAQGALGLRSPGFVFERALIVGRDPGGGALGAWVEGVFLYTDTGFAALAIERIEAPRPDHADLELAVCELRARDERPHP